jgi:hypothetical protein
LRRFKTMAEHIDTRNREELQELYEALHLTCERAATLLRLSAATEVPMEQTLRELRQQEIRAAELWRRISEIHGY